jgi:hypothetical protein
MKLDRSSPSSFSRRCAVGLHLPPHCRGVQDPAQRQDFAQQVGG